MQWFRSNVAARHFSATAVSRIHAEHLYVAPPECRFVGADRCLRKNLTCVRKQSTRFTPELSTQLALVDSGQIIKPEVKPEFIPEEPQPGVVRKALNSVQQVTTYVASGLYSMLENRLNGILAMGGTLNAILAVDGARHLTWCLTYCLLRREVVRNQLQTTAPLEPTVLVNVEGHW